MNSAGSDGDVYMMVAGSSCTQMPSPAWSANVRSVSASKPSVALRAGLRIGLRKREIVIVDAPLEAVRAAARGVATIVEVPAA